MSTTLLQAAKASLATAASREASNDQAILAQESVIRLGRQHLSDFTSAIARAAVDCLLTGKSNVAEAAGDATATVAIREKNAGDEKTLELLKQRSVMRKRETLDARSKYNAAARKHIYDQLMPDAQANLESAWEHVRVALFRVAALSRAAEIEYINPSHSSLPMSLDGPAGEVVTALAEARFPLGHSSSAAPGWLHSLDPGRQIPRNTQHEEVARIVASVEAAAEATI